MCVTGLWRVSDPPGQKWDRDFSFWCFLVETSLCQSLGQQYHLVFKQMPPIWISLTYLHLPFSAACFDLSTRTQSNLCLAHHSDDALVPVWEQAGKGTCHLYQIHSAEETKVISLICRNHRYVICKERHQQIILPEAVNLNQLIYLLCCNYWGGNDSKCGISKIPSLLITTGCVVCVSQCSTTPSLPLHRRTSVFN